MDLRLIAAYIVAILLEVGMPIALGIYAHRRLGVSWRYFWYGALIFFLFQMVTRVPTVQILQVALAEPLKNSVVLQWAWLFGLAITAGLFEEVGRYLGYRHLVFRGYAGKLRREDTETPGRGDAENPALGTRHSAWRKGVMYGLGHGGLESMLLVAGLATLSLIQAATIAKMDPAAIAILPPEQAEAVRRARAVFESIPWWLPLLGAFERLAAVVIQIGFSILVLQVFLRGSIWWLYLAIGAHFLVDFVAVASVRWLGPVGTEVLVGLFAVIAAYLILRLRPATEPASG